jgi:progressive ankylosis protein
MTAPRKTPIAAEPLRQRTIILFWFPLAATWFMMGLEGPYIAAIVARMPEAARGLAAFGVATSLAWLIESPIMMLLSAATTLVRDRASYVALRRFSFLLNALVTLGMVLLALPPVFRFVGEGLLGLPPEISRQAQMTTAILILWPAAIGYRRFYQGVLVRHHLTRRVAYGTVIRLAAMSITALVLALNFRLPGATLGALALLSGVIAEAAASRWMAHGVVRSLMRNPEVAEGTLLTIPQIARL